MKFVFLAALIAFASANLHREAFVNWMHEHNRAYTNQEFHQKFKTFSNNLNYINTHNSEKHSYKLALNEFADMTHEEFKASYFGFRSEAHVQTNVDKSLENVDVSALPASKDWRKEGAVTPIKNQGQCGSCWSFSATGSTEGAHEIATKKLVGLSEQNLVDCSTSEGNMGCNGGLMDDAFKYIISNKGIDSEASYPYTASGPNQCKFKAADVAATLSSYKDIPQGNEDALQAAVANVGPVSVAMDASHSSFQFYSSGIYWSYFCSSTSLDHGVLAVGYGSTSKREVVPVEVEAGAWNGKDYWIVKNSWGTTWGNQGYFWLARNDGNMCGVATAASYPIV